MDIINIIPKTHISLWIVFRTYLMRTPRIHLGLISVFKKRISGMYHPHKQDATVTWIYIRTHVTPMVLFLSIKENMFWCKRLESETIPVVCHAYSYVDKEIKTWRMRCSAAVRMAKIAGVGWTTTFWTLCGRKLTGTAVSSSPAKRYRCYRRRTCTCIDQDSFDREAVCHRVYEWEKINIGAIMWETAFLRATSFIYKRAPGDLEVEGKRWKYIPV